MTCKDCIHDEVCEKHSRLVQIDEHTWEEYVALDDVEKFCPNFKNKANFVQVVRCENCTTYDDHRYCTYHESTVLDSDFCSYGDRRDT